MEWQEINCVIEALDALIDKYEDEMQNSDLDEDELSDLSNDLAYAQTLLGSYRQKRDEMAAR
jgi:hypothetical protein